MIKNPKVPINDLNPQVPKNEMLENSNDLNNSQAMKLIKEYSYVYGQNIKLRLYFTCGKYKKKCIKKHVKNEKSRNFQKVLKSSILLQITFWIAENISIDYFKPNPKHEENS